MNSIELEVKDTYNDKQNIMLKIDGREVGILYFTEDQKNEFLKILRRGKSEDVELIEPIDFDEEDYLDDPDEVE